MYNLIIIGIVAIALIALLVTLVKRYKRCPSDKLLVIYGKTGKNSSGDVSTARVTHGGGQFIWPVIQDYQFLDLKPISIDVNLMNALSKQNIRIDVPSTFTVAISSEPNIRQNAAERLLGLNRIEVENLARDIIFGQMRLVIATMDIEEINQDRDSFLSNIQNNLEDELKKIGLKLINVNIRDISDESNYFEALGQEATAKVINDAKVLVAEKTREGEIGVAKAQKEQTISVSAATADAKIGQAKAEQKRRIQESEANARAIEGENTAAIDIANSTADRNVAEAEAKKITTTAQKVKAAEALEESYKAEESAENQRAEKEKATQYANVVVPAEIDKQKRVVEAEAEAEAIRKIAQGEADAKYLEMEAEAKGINEILTKQADGFAKLVKASGSPENAVRMLITDKIDRLMEIQMSAIQNINFDKITVWDTGSGDGGSSTGNFVQNLFKMLPPFEEIYKQVGTELPQLLQGAGSQEAAKIEAVEDASKDVVYEDNIVIGSDKDTDELDKDTEKNEEEVENKKKSK